MDSEIRFTELRFNTNGRSVSGIVIVYGDTATIGGRFRERFETGAFGDVAGADVILNLQHQRAVPLSRTGKDGTMDLTQIDNRIEMRAMLPDTTAGRDAAELVKTGVLRGLSVEFIPISERNMAGVRVIERARLTAIGLVDKPAYSNSTVNKRWWNGVNQWPKVRYFL